MPRKKTPKPATPLVIEGMVQTIRGQRVMLDFHLAELYGVTTGALNQAVARNEDRFPARFAFRLAPEEFTALISQNVISKVGRGGRQQVPYAFTEHGVVMLSSVLRSKIAVQVSIAVVDAFVRLRQLLATPGELVTQLQQLTTSVKMHDDQLRVINEVLRRMLEAPPPPPRRPIGFRPSEPTTPEARP